MKKKYFLFFLLSFKILAQTPELDNTFNIKETGVYQQNIGHSPVLLPNNKILSVFEYSYTYKVILLNPDGSLDKAFNSTDSYTTREIRIFPKSDGGFITLDRDGKLKAFNADGTINSGFAISTLKNVSSNPIEIKNIIYQDDGKAIVHGVFETVNDIFTGGCVRLNPDGSIDKTFKLQSGGNKLVIQSDGKYVITSRTNVYRYLADGKIDPTFTIKNTIDPVQKYVTNGFETANNSSINDIAVQPDGKIIAVGCNFVENGKTISYYIVRLNTNGTRDTSFKSLDSRSFNINKIYLQKDNKIILFQQDGNQYIRLNSDGTIDTTFKYTNTSPFFSGEGTLFFQDDKMIINGNFKNGAGTTRSRIHRINTDGSIDLTFNPHSGLNMVFDEFNDYDQYPYLAKVLVDQKTILIGNFSSYNDTGFKNMCRINQNGEFDPTFKLDPSVKIIADSNTDYGIIQQKDGKIILMHNNAITINNTPKSIIRLNSDGSIDNNFSYNPYNQIGSVSQIKILSNGKFLVIGQYGFFQSKVGNYNTYNVIQLNSDGSFDTNYKANFFHKPINLFPLSNDKVLISLQQDNYAYPYYPALRLNEDGKTDASFQSGKQIYHRVKELPNGKLIITDNNRLLSRINADGSPDSTFTTYSFNNNTINNYDFYENGQISLILSSNSTDTTDKLTFSSEGALLNTKVYNTSGKFEIQNCEDLLFYNYFTKIENINKNGIVRYKISNLDSNPNPLGEIFQSFSNGQTLEDLKVTGDNIKWYTTQSNCGINNKFRKKESSNTETILPSSTTLLTGTTYYASQTTNGIESSYRLPVTVYSTTLAINENNLPNLFTYPNPVKDYYTISNSEEINKVEVYNVSGQLQIRNSYNNSNIKIDFTSLSSGLYFVKIFSAGKTATIKTIKN